MKNEGAGVKKRKGKEPLTQRIMNAASGPFVAREFLRLGTTEAYIVIALHKLLDAGLVRRIGLRHTWDYGRESLYEVVPERERADAVASDAIGRVLSASRAAWLPQAGPSEKSAMAAKMTGLAGRRRSGGSFGESGPAGTGDPEAKLAGANFFKLPGRVVTPGAEVVTNTGEQG